VLFIGWFLAKDTTTAELSSQGKYKLGYYRLFMFLVKFAAPLAIALLFGLGIYSKLITIFPSLG
jgi:NSS family neurotransmitter:Na+ symporter